MFYEERINADAEVWSRTSPDAPFYFDERRTKQFRAASKEMFEALSIIARGQPDGLDHAVDVARLERAIRIASAALAKARGDAK